MQYHFLDGDVPRFLYHGVRYIPQLILFARVSSYVRGFKNRNHFCQYHKLRKAFSQFYYMHSESIVKFNIGLKALLQQGISVPIFYIDLVNKLKRIIIKSHLVINSKV